MVKTALGYPDEPSRKAIVAAAAVNYGSAYLAGPKRNAVLRFVAPLAGTLGVRQLAILLTRWGVV